MTNALHPPSTWVLTVPMGCGWSCADCFLCDDQFPPGLEPSRYLAGTLLGYNEIIGEIVMQGRDK